MTETVGIFGLGLIGIALAERLLKAGHMVRGSDPDPAREDILNDKGGEPARPEQVWRCDIVLSAVFTTEQLADIVAGAPNLRDQVIVSMSTCDPDLMEGLADAAAQKGIRLVEAPISGTSRQVAQGTALLLLAGDPTGLDRFEQIADAISVHRERVGAIGDGNRTKLAINCVLGLKRAAVAEGLVLAEALGLDAATFLATANRSAARSDVMAAKGPLMVERNFAPLGRIAQSQKDFLLIRDMAARNGYGALPMVGRYLDLMEEATAAGEADLDNSAVMLAIARTAKR